MKNETVINERVIERLRTSKVFTELAECKRGREAGEAWALGVAEAYELLCLEELYDVSERSIPFNWDEFFAEQLDTYTPRECLFFSLHPESWKDRRAAQDFWECAIGDSLEKSVCPDEFLMGFVEGAIAFWKSVKDKL